MRTGGGNEACIEQIELIHQLVDSHAEDLELALASKDIPEIAGRGKIAVLVGVEGGHAIENDMGNLERYYEMGARYMTLTHNENTPWADASYDVPEHGGLTSFGEEVVWAMNRLGMLVDLSPEAFGEQMKAWEKLQPERPKCYVGHLVDHIDHLVKVAGIDHVGLGSDYDGITYGPRQMADVSGFPYITQELLNRGYSSAEIKKILGENFIRLLSQAEKS